MFGSGRPTGIMDVAMLLILGAAVVGAFARPQGIQAALGGIGSIVTKTTGILTLQPNAGG